MIFSDRSKRLLKQQIAKSKLAEYGIPKNYYPSFTENANELSIPTIYILSKYSESVIDGNLLEQDVFYRYLSYTAQYFEVSYLAADRKEYNSDFIVSGASAYFLSGDYKRAKALCTAFHRSETSFINVPQRILLELLEVLLAECDFTMMRDQVETMLSDRISDAIRQYCTTWKLLLDGFESDKGTDDVLKALQDYRRSIISNKDTMEIYFVDILFAVVKVALSKMERPILAKQSGIETNLWSNCLCDEGTQQILSPILQMSAEKGVLRGKNAIIQISSYADKVRSIELIARSAYLSGRTETVMVVVPALELHNEIADDLMSRLGRDTLVKRYSNALKRGHNDSSLNEFKTQMIICSAEELPDIAYNDKQLFEQSGAFVFTDGYIQTDDSLEACYELLMAEMREHISKDKQFVLLSSGIANPEVFKRWFLADDGVLAVDEQKAAMPNLLGFVSSDGLLHGFLDNSSAEDFCVPCVLDPVGLNQHKYFPENNGIDIALYWANKLLGNGIPAILVDKQDSIKPIIDRMDEIREQRNTLFDFWSYQNAREINDLCNLICFIYGKSWIWSSYRQGVAILYPELPDGIKLAAEDLIRKNKLKAMICTPEYLKNTSIPIRYLLVASPSNDNVTTAVRNFRRPSYLSSQFETYPETDIIFVKPNNCCNEAKKIIITTDGLRMISERFGTSGRKLCSSKILELVSDLKINSRVTISGTEIVGYMSEHYADGDCLDNYAIVLSEKYPRYRKVVCEALESRKKTMIETENCLCSMISRCDNMEDANNLAVLLSKETLAYQMADEDKRIEIESLFHLISERISKLDRKRMIACAKASVGIDCFNKIEDLVTKFNLTSKVFSDKELVSIVTSSFAETHNLKWDQRAVLKEVCNKWIGSYAVREMTDSEKDVLTYQSVCNDLVSKQLSRFVGAIIHVVQGSKQGLCDDPVPQLLLLQRRMKYGVVNETAASICEVVFNERLLATRLTQIIGDDEVGTDSIIDAIKTNKADILLALNDFPAYFSERINWLCEQ